MERWVSKPRRGFCLKSLTQLESERALRVTDCFPGVLAQGSAFGVFLKQGHVGADWGGLVTVPFTAVAIAVDKLMNMVTMVAAEASYLMSAMC